MYISELLSFMLGWDDALQYRFIFYPILVLPHKSQLMRCKQCTAIRSRGHPKSKHLCWVWSGIARCIWLMFLHGLEPSIIGFQETVCQFEIFLLRLPFLLRQNHKWQLLYSQSQPAQTHRATTRHFFQGCRQSTKRQNELYSRLCELFCEYP